MQNIDKHPVSILKITVNTLINNPVIVYPFFVIAFLQLLAIEILYFSPRFPLSVFFGPLIKRIWGEVFLHYPYNFVLLPKMFFYAQLFIYVFFGGFLTACAVHIIKEINSGKRIVLLVAIRDTLSKYLHIVLATVLSLLLLSGLSEVYNLVFRRALIIRSQAGIFGLIKNIVIHGTPYFQLLIAMVVTTVFVFVIPIIVIENKKIFGAIINNFKSLWQMLGVVVVVVFLPMLLYAPVLALRSTVPPIQNLPFPELQILIIILSIVTTLFIDAVVVTATTMLYLVKKERET